MLTANHVPTGAVTLSGVAHAAVPGTAVRLDHAPGVPTDLKLFRIQTDPGLTPLSISAATPALGTESLLFGNGRNRGVWAVDRKIASLGVNVRRWVTMHGIALNIDPPMHHFGLINPCGLGEVEMTSLAAESRAATSFDDVASAFTVYPSLSGSIAEVARVLHHTE